MNRSRFGQLNARPAAWRKLVGNAQDRTAEISQSSAIIFAPHQDDETLGCGGTIIKKCRSGAKVACVFMTDGRTSHQGFLPPEELSDLRQQEALEATEILGIPARDVHFLRFQDSKLGDFHGEALKRVSDLLQTYRPTEVFVPYRNDGTRDHESTYRIVFEAVVGSRLELKLFEYPVWFWNQWPWVSLELRPNRTSVRSLQRSFSYSFGKKALQEFGTSVFVGDVLPLKRKALEAHRSQMNVLHPETAWPTLHDVSNGEFVKCFFQDFEFFRVTSKFS